MFSLLLSGRLGDMIAPRLDFDEELTSLLKAGLFDAALTLMKQKDGEMTFVNKLDKSGLALIHIACASGAMEFLVELVSLGAEISLPSSSGSTALHFAAVNSRKDIIKFLLREGADPSIPNENGMLAGELATNQDIRMLLSSDPSRMCTRSRSVNTLSEMNQARKNLKVFAEATGSSKALISSGTSPNMGFGNLSISGTVDDNVFPVCTAKRSIGGEEGFISPISMDLLACSTTGLKKLLSKNNDIYNNDANSDNSYLGEMDGESELRQAVLQAAVDTAVVMQKHIDGALHRLKIAEYCQNPKHENQLRKLLKLDSTLATCRAHKLGILAPDGLTPLHIAALNNNVKAMEILLEYDDVSTWAVDLQGMTPLHLAAGASHGDACAFLRSKMKEQRGGEVDPVGCNAPINLSGTTPLGWASVCASDTPRGTPSLAIRSALFKVGDRTVLPLTPARLRSGTSPRRKIERIVNDKAVLSEEALVYAFSVAQGWKGEMEDKVLTMTPVTDVPCWNMFAVFDGHGGSFTVDYLHSNIANVLTRTVLDIQKQIGTITEDSSKNVLEAVLKETCATLDLEMSIQPRMIAIKKKDTYTCHDYSGSTANICLFSKRYLAIANVGDSRALLAQWVQDPPFSADKATPQRCEVRSERSKGVLRASALSRDHKFNIEEERIRAENANAKVTVVEGPNTDPDARKEFEVYTMRCNNGTSRLRMSRSFGDFYLKQQEGLPADKQAVIAVPEVRIVERSSSDAFVLLACDGVFDVMENQEIVDLLANSLGCRADGVFPGGSSSARCAEACDSLLKECVDRGAHDNLSAVIVLCGTGPAQLRTTAHTSEEAPSVVSIRPPYLTSPEGVNPASLQSPTSGARDRTPTDKALSRVFATLSPDDQFDGDASVSRHLEFARELR